MGCFIWSKPFKKALILNLCKTTNYSWLFHVIMLFIFHYAHWLNLTGSWTLLSTLALPLQYVCMRSALHKVVLAHAQWMALSPALPPLSFRLRGFWDIRRVECCCSSEEDSSPGAALASPLVGIASLIQNLQRENKPFIIPFGFI